MADRRIRVPVDKASLVDELADRSQGGPAFRSKADVLTFAAAVGLSRNERLPLAQGGTDPIRFEVFERQGQDTLINLIAICETMDPLVLAGNDDMEDRRATIFEEYANGGLRLLQEELRGVVDATERVGRLVQLVATMRAKESRGPTDDIDISEFIV